MDWSEWRAKLVSELGRIFGMSPEDTEEHVAAAEDTYREYFDDGESVDDVVEGEMDAARWAMA